MTFLKKLGQILAKVAGVAMGIGPLVEPFLGSSKAVQTGVNDFTQIAQMVVTIETAMQGSPGTAKMTAVLPLVTNIVKTSEVVANKKIANETLFTTACTEITQGVVDLLNSIHPDAAQPS